MAKNKNNKAKNSNKLNAEFAEEFSQNQSSSKATKDASLNAHK